MGWRRHSGRVTLESSHKWAENCLMCEELAPTQMWLYLHRNWTPFLSLLYGFGCCFWCFHTIYTLSPRAEPEETPNFSSTFPLHFSEITQIYKLSRRQWQWYKNWHRLLHEDSSSSSSLHFNSAKMTNKNKAMANGLKKWALNTSWKALHQGDMYFCVFSFQTEQKLFFQAERWTAALQSCWRQIRRLRWWVS